MSLEERSLLLPRRGECLPAKRSWWQLFRIDALQFGIAFCYATQTALVTPIVLRLGLPNYLFGIVWFISPLLGCCLGPVISSGSDRCRNGCGRRRPFLLALSMGIIIGVVLYLNGGDIGVIISRDEKDTLWSIVLTMVGVALVDFCIDASDFPANAYLVDVCNPDDVNKALNLRIVLGGLGGGLGYIVSAVNWMSTPIGTALGSELRVICLFNVALYTISVALTLCSIPEVPLKVDGQPTSSSLSYCCCCADDDDDLNFEDVRNDREGSHAVNSKASSTQTDDSGSADDEEGGDEGDGRAGQNDKKELLAEQTGSIQTGLPRPNRPIQRHKQTRRSRRDRNWRGLQSTQTDKVGNVESDVPQDSSYHIHFFPSPESPNLPVDDNSVSTRATVHSTNEVSQTGGNIKRKNNLTDGAGNSNVNVNAGEETLRGDGAAKCPVDVEYATLNKTERQDGGCHDNQREPLSIGNVWKSAIFMPCILRRLMFNHTISWTAFLTMLLFFTDYMAQVVYLGDPIAPQNSTALLRYDLGVKMGCWGLCIYAFSTVITELLVARLMKYMRLRTIYVFGQLIFAVGCGSLLLTVGNPYATIAICVTFGIEFAVITKIPTSIIAIYHQSPSYTHPEGGLVRGFVTDYACLGGHVFLAQIIVSTLLGPLVRATGTRLTLVVCASAIGFLSALLSACFISYEI